MRSFQTNQSVNKTNASDGLFKPVTQQNLPQNRNQAVQNTNVLKPGMYRIASTTTQTRTPQLPHASRNTNPHMSKSSGVIHTTSVSRPQLKCYQVKDKVMPNNSQVKFKKKEVEDHHRISFLVYLRKQSLYCDCTNSSYSLLLLMHKAHDGNPQAVCNFVDKFWVLFVLEMIICLQILLWRSDARNGPRIKTVYYVEGLQSLIFSRLSHSVMRILRYDRERWGKSGQDERKRDPCVMVGYSTQSKGYRVYNKRSRLIVESIHIKFDKIKEMMSDHNSSDLAPQRQETFVKMSLFSLVDREDRFITTGLRIFSSSPLLEEYTIQHTKSHHAKFKQDDSLHNPKMGSSRSQEYVDRRTFKEAYGEFCMARSQCRMNFPQFHRLKSGN
ncbi:hypothetical protein Tco_0729967 [Tanacetum coccineum]|uniref:Retroviral polymerase SH3-like domain-containing protein n=1 Tax=Tanacetum coccineum TaxID=301880 RepID=A0ABQ4YSV6_9ASTR